MKLLFKPYAAIFLVFLVMFSCKEENTPPMITINTPVNEDIYYIGDNVEVNVEAEDIDGNISEVRFYINDEGVGSSNSFPYIFSWNTTGIDEGVYVIQVKAFDNENATSSDEVSVELQIKIDPPNAAFYGNPLSGNFPLVVSFTDSSTNIPTSWFWDFGDGNTSTEQNPTHAYSDAGAYSVVLTVRNEAGSNTLELQNYINVTTPVLPPVVAFEGNPTSGNAPLEVIFSDQSTNIPTSWFWDFGDGNTSTEQNPTHTYSDAGDYSVVLNVGNEAGSNTLEIEDYINVSANGFSPVIEFEGNPTSGDAPLEVVFSDQSTNIPTGWLWDFGDGNTSTEQNPTHLYNNGGIYSVSLTATNEYGSATYTIENFITVQEQGEPPIAAFDADPTSGYYPLEVSFTDESTNFPTTWRWDFGDGGSSMDKDPKHTYSDPGLYTVSLTVENEHGSASYVEDDYIQIMEVGEPPVAAFNAEPTTGTAPLNVSFSDESTNNPISWTWDFGDGETSTEQNPSHTYYSSGSYSVTLIAENNFGNDVEEKQNFIQIYEQGEVPVAGFSATPTTGDEPLPVRFNDESLNDPTSWLWDFGDGATSSNQDAIHLYTEPGIYDVSLTVENEFGNDVLQKNSYIQVNLVPKPPIAAFSGSPTAGVTPLDVSFIDESENFPTEWLWDFGDGHTSTEQNPIHTYTLDGTHTVSLTVTNEMGDDNIVIQDYITVEGAPPITDFVGLPTTGNVPLSVQFLDETINNPDTWQWDFGDGNTSTEQHPTHIYEEVGNYTVILLTSNELGSDDELKYNYIIVNSSPPIAEFSANPTVGVPPLEVHFSDQSLYDPTAWLWDFGDGSTSTEQNPIHIYDDAGIYSVSLTVSNDVGSDTKVLYDFVTTLFGLPCPDAPSVEDIDGNIYNTVQIGEQCWMKENLRVTHYPNGDPIPHIADSTEWGLLGNTSGDAYCYYENNLDLLYGALYTYQAAIAVDWTKDLAYGQGVCPDGWHLSSYIEWENMKQYLISHGFNWDGTTSTDKTAKSLATTYDWNENDLYEGSIGYDLQSNNLSGFSGLPGGQRLFEYEGQCGLFSGRYHVGNWWMHSYPNCEYAYVYLYEWLQGLSMPSTNPKNGLSVRCVKNN